MWQSNISFCSSCSEEMPHHYLPLLFCCVAGLYGFVPRVRLNRLNWPKVVKMGSQRRKKGASWKWSPGSCHPGIPSLSFPLPLSDWEGFLQLLDPCLATDMPTAMSHSHYTWDSCRRMCYVQSPALLFSHFTLGPTQDIAILLPVDPGYTNSCQQFSNKNDVCLHKMPFKNN